METRAKVADHKMCCLYQPNSAQTFPHWQNEGLRICRVVHITISQEATPAQGWAGPDDATSVWAPTAAPVAQLKGHPGLLRFFFRSVCLLMWRGFRSQACFCRNASLLSVELSMRFQAGEWWLCSLERRPHVAGFPSRTVFLGSSV